MANTTNRIARVSADYKDMQGLIDSFADAVRKFGLNIVDDPGCEGSDMVGFVISDKPLSESELSAICEIG